MQIKVNIGYHQTIGDNPQYLVFLQDIILSIELERNIKLYFTIKFYYYYENSKLYYTIKFHLLL